MNGQLRKAIVPGDAVVEKLVAELMQQVTLKFMHCADAKLLNNLVRPCLNTAAVQFDRT